MTLSYFNTQRRCDYLFVFLFFVVSIIQLFLIAFAPLDLSPDEAYYWDWSRNLDWSYYSKGPIIAFLIRISCLVFGETAFAVRFPAFLCLSITSLIFYFFIRRKFSMKIALISWVALRTMLLFFSQGFLMTTDSSAALFWLLAVIAVFYATIEDQGWYWIPALAAIGVGVSSKYTLIILYPSIILFLIVAKPMRSHLRDKRFWLGTLVMIASISPILLWNMNHGWVNIQHNAGHLVSSRSFLTLKFLPELIGGQLGLVGPVFFIVFLLAIKKAFIQWRNGDNESGLYLCTIFPLFAICLLLSLTRRIYLNWPMPIYVSGLILIVHLVCSANFLKNSVLKLCKWHFSLNGLFLLVTCLFVMDSISFVPGELLPTKKLVGWSTLSEKVQEEIKSQEQKAVKDPVIISGSYEVAAELSFYLESQPRTYCAPVGNRRMNQYDIWGGWEKLKGENAIIVLKNPNQSKELASYFENIEAINPQPNFVVNYNNSVINSFYFYRAYNNTGYSPIIPEER